MKIAQLSQNLLHPSFARTWRLRDHFETILAGLIGAFFGLLMGMTALVAFLGVQEAAGAGRPGMLLIKVIVVGTFVILSVILFTYRFGDEEEEEDN